MYMYVCIYVCIMYIYYLLMFHFLKHFLIFIFYCKRNKRIKYKAFIIKQMAIHRTSDNNNNNKIILF